MITESGCSYGMGPDADGVVDDQPRIDYLDGHLRAVAEAVARGVDVRGYSTWSLLDDSSGTRASPRASAWCTSTSTPRCALPSGPSSGTPT